MHEQTNKFNLTGRELTGELQHEGVKFSNTCQQSCKQDFDALQVTSFEMVAEHSMTGLATRSEQEGLGGNQYKPAGQGEYRWH